MNKERSGLNVHPGLIRIYATAIGKIDFATIFRRKEPSQRILRRLFLEIGSETVRHD